MATSQPMQEFVTNDANYRGGDFSHAQSYVEVEGAGMVAKSEADGLNRDLVTELPDAVSQSSEGVPQSPEVTAHQERQAELSEATREAAAAILHNTLET